MTELSLHSADSLNIIQPFIEHVADQGDVQILGGVGTVALGYPGTKIDVSAKEVIVPKDFTLPAQRTDGTKRDVDVLVLSSDAARIAEVETTLEQTVGDRLERSVFGILPHETLRKQLARPFGSRALHTLLSDRYEATADDNNIYTKSLLPFAVPIDPETLETWSLVIGDDTRVPIPHVGVIPLNYSNRSISGVRPRDKEKMTHVTQNILSLAPSMREWIYDGPGKSQLELSRLVASLRHPGQKNMSLIDGIRADTFTHEQLIDHEAFQLKDLSRHKQRMLIGQAAFKATALHAFESTPWAITFLRQRAEKQVDYIVKNA